uniref:Uncharacterized protein n=1 Tax=Ananas comosus var. bracteatus TaxID=296719 RepID=A0A6V7NWL3_ANACO|nr:unnamed protein product [Ananas comosus var. bracteatus]
MESLQRRSTPPLTYNVWIRLVSLPYECWSSHTVAALVGGFGRFIRADDHTKRMIDLSGYRCLIKVNHLSDIPENLEITFGDILCPFSSNWKDGDVASTTAAGTPLHTMNKRANMIRLRDRRELEFSVEDLRPTVTPHTLSERGTLPKSAIEGEPLPPQPPSL